MMFGITEISNKRNKRKKLRHTGTNTLLVELQVVQKSIDEQCTLRVRTPAYFNEAALEDSKAREKLLVDELRRRNVDANYSAWTHPDRLRQSFS